ncbi:Leukocyte immunoglobulin-like receptor subfamily B member 3 [Manis javanica]|nr:Leukocyte immunoglobulin-like receptor subfamily B member 3 [Manis javanica]
MGGSASTTTTLAALLCLGLCRGPRDRVQAGTLPKPSIWADPGSMVTKGSPVTIHCQGPQEAATYTLYKEVSGSWTVDGERKDRDKADFSIGSTGSSLAGRYQCGYQNGSRKSEHSDTLTLVVTGVYDPPSLSADPSPLVASGGTVSLRCRSEVTGGTFYLLKEGEADSPQHVVPLFSAGGWQARFPVDPVTTSHAGTYRCYTSETKNPYVWSLPSGPLALEVTGVYKEPSLSARPGALVPSGHSLTLQCHSEAGFDRFALTKEGLPTPQGLDGQPSSDFPLGQANGTHGGRYRCYGAHNVSHVWSAPSAPLDVLVTGAYKKPSLSALPSPVVTSGGNITLQCHSRQGFSGFALTQDGGQGLPESLVRQPQAHIPLGPVKPSHGGRYRCYGAHSLSSEWSAPSDPLDILVAGQLPDRPSLSVQPGPTVAPGETVTLLCQSGSPRDTFLLSKEGAAQPPLRLRSKNGAQQSQAEFSMSPVTSAHGGTYRCYSANSSAPYLLSQPSVPLELRVSGPKWPVLVLVGVSAACALLLAVLLLLLLRRQRLRRRRKPGAADAESGDRGPQRSSGPADDAQETLYATVMDAQPEGVEPDPQAAAPDAPQEVTYAQLNHLTLRRATPAPPSSQAGQPPAEPSVYAALATR